MNRNYAAGDRDWAAVTGDGGVRLIPLRHLVTVRVSNVDKVADPDQIPVRLCNYTDVYNNDRITNGLNFMTSSATSAQIQKFSLRVGDVIITKDSEDRADIAVPAYVLETAPDLICGYHLAILRARRGIARGEFLFWAIQAKFIREAFSNAAGGITRFGLTLGGIKSVSLPCPDLEIQKAIADFLDRETARIDQLIEKKQRLVELIDEKRASLITATVTGQLDPATGKPCPVYEKVSDIITLQERVHLVPPPPEWNLNKLHCIFKVRKGHKNTDMQEDNLLSLSYGRIVRKNIDTAEGLLPASFETYQIVEPGNIVMRLTDLQNDKRSLRQGLVRERGIITSAYDALEVGKEHDPRFWAYALLALDLAKYYYSLGGGVRQSIKFSDFPNEWIAVPDRETQKAIADFLDRETTSLERIKIKTAEAINLLKEYRSALITAAVTGQIDVESWSRSGETGRGLAKIEQDMSTPSGD